MFLLVAAAFGLVAMAVLGLEQLRRQMARNGGARGGLTAGRSGRVSRLTARDARDRSVGPVARAWADHHVPQTIQGASAPGQIAAG
jgi:hypothetical protein